MDIFGLIHTDTRDIITPCLFYCSTSRSLNTEMGHQSKPQSGSGCALLLCRDIPIEELDLNEIYLRLPSAFKCYEPG